jgi:hypothetical protein
MKSRKDGLSKSTLKAIKLKALKLQAGKDEGNSIITPYSAKDDWVIGEIATPVGLVPQVSTKWSIRDRWGGIKARWGVNRMNYKINPGLYAVGNPDSDSHVLVTANYKLTFDKLRKELTGMNLWILVLDTKGINVWCAAGKGTFGTRELVSRLKRTRLNEIVSHHTIILPQLGAPGVSAHQVLKQSGFRIVFGPVRAADIGQFISLGMKATQEMREVTFNAYDRLVLTPIELVQAMKPSIILFGILFILNLIGIGPFGLVDFYAYLGALVMGCVITPFLLPWIPGRAFSLKGWMIGLIWALAVNLLNGFPAMPAYSILKALAYILILPSVSAFYAMNFTGSSTYTSFSGVLKEMKIAVPVMAVTITAGILLMIINSFV